jgi:hypothetical protein
MRFKLKNYDFRIANNLEEVYQGINYYSKISLDFNNRNIDQEEFARKLYKKGVVVIVFKRDEIVGIIGYYVNEFIHSYGFLSIIARSPSESGLGQPLLEMYHNDCMEKKLLSSRLEVSKNNIKAINFYERNGYSVLEERIDSFILIRFFN